MLKLFDVPQNKTRRGVKKYLLSDFSSFCVFATLKGLRSSQ